MKLPWPALLLTSALVFVGGGLAQSNTGENGDGAKKTTSWETTVFLRSSAAKNGQFFNYTEAALDNGRRIVFDPGWLNFGRLGYGEIFFGAGRIHPIGKKGVLITELYYDRSYGSLSDHASYLQTYVSMTYELRKGWSADTALFPYLPLDHKGTFQFVVDDAAVRKKLNSRLQVSAGYAAYKFGRTALANKEYGSFTLFTKSRGSMETMVMHVPGLPGGVGVQFRYVVSLKEK